MVDRSRLSFAIVRVIHRSLRYRLISRNSYFIFSQLYPRIFAVAKLKRGNSNVWGLIKIDLRSEQFTMKLLHLHLLSRNVSSFHTKARKRRIPSMMIYKFYTLDSIRLICKADNLKRRLCQQIWLYWVLIQRSWWFWILRISEDNRWHLIVLYEVFAFLSDSDLQISLTYSINHIKSITQQTWFSAFFKSKGETHT